MTDIVERLRTLHREITECDGGECEMMVTVRHAADEIERLRAMLRSAMCLIHGLACPGCKAQGREMAAPGHCCRDADCDAGWYGIGCDEVKDFLEAADRLMPGTLAEIENPPLPRNERSPLPPASEDGGETP